MLIDTHSHIDGEEFDDDRDEVVKRAKDVGVGTILIPNVNAVGLDKMLQICTQHPGYLYPMIGLHPEDVKQDYVDVLDDMEKRIVDGHPFVAVGEVGLDFYWDTTYREEQMEAFDRQVQWAVKYHLPLMIHCRSAHQEMIDVLERYRDCGLKGVFHCFTGTEEEAQRLLSFDGFLLGIGGVLTFKKSKLPDVLANAVPLHRIVLETDAPYMAPVPHRGKRNESAFVVEVAKCLAGVYQVAQSEVEDVTTRNAIEMFGKLPFVGAD